jgi:integration host factor subunit alpha
MENKNFTKKDLTGKIHKKIGFSKNFSSKLINDFLDLFSNELKNSKKIKISTFGTFEVISKKQRVGRNPKTKEAANISARKVIKFRCSAQFKNKLNNL